MSTEVSLMLNTPWNVTNCVTVKKKNQIFMNGMDKIVHIMESKRLPCLYKITIKKKKSREIWPIRFRAGSGKSTCR